MAIKLGGLRLYKQMVDSPLVRCLSSDSTPLGNGDPVKFAGSSGQIGSGQYVATVTRAASGDPIFGVVMGVEQESVASSDFSLSRMYKPASVAMYILIRPALHSDLYAVSQDGSWLVTDIAANANLTGNGGGTSMTDCDATTGLSTCCVDTSTVQTTATLQVQVVGFVPQATNVPGAANADLIVRLNNIQNSGGTGTAGI